MLNANDTLANAKVEPAVLRVKSQVAFDSTYISAYSWVGSWADKTWDDFTLDRERAEENNLIGTKRMDTMDNGTPTNYHLPIQY
jgi:hypothetical protein